MNNLLGYIMCLSILLTQLKIIMYDMLHYFFLNLKFLLTVAVIVAFIGYGFYSIPKGLRARTDKIFLQTWGYAQPEFSSLASQTKEP